jgi:hypothetical protein
VCPLCSQQLKHRVSALEAAGHQAQVLREENAVLRQQIMEVDAAVREGRPLPPLPLGAMDHASMAAAQQQQQQQQHSAAAAAAAAAAGGSMPGVFDTSPGLQGMQGGAAGLQQQQAAGSALRSMDSFSGSAAINTDAPAAHQQAAALAGGGGAAAAAALPLPDGMKVVPLPVPPAAAATAAAPSGGMVPVGMGVVPHPGAVAAGGGSVHAAGGAGGSVGAAAPFNGSVQSLQAMMGGAREGSVDVTSVAAAAAAAVAAGASAPIAVPMHGVAAGGAAGGVMPARSHASGDGGVLQMANSTGGGGGSLGTSPAMMAQGPSPGVKVEEVREMRGCGQQARVVVCLCACVQLSWRCLTCPAARVCGLLPRPAAGGRRRVCQHAGGCAGGAGRARRAPAGGLAACRSRDPRRQGARCDQPGAEPAGHGAGHRADARGAGEED